MSEEKKSVLIVSGTVPGGESLRELFDREHHPIAVTDNTEEAKALINQIEFDFVVILTPLKDEFGVDFALSLSGVLNAGIILLVKNECFEQVRRKAEKNGIITLSEPLSETLLSQALAIITATHQRWRNYREENKKLQTKIEEIRIVARAKVILVEYLKMSEAQAHKYIEKQAMDLRISKREVAESILKTYES